jgi:hypothetical protein
MMKITNYTKHSDEKLLTISKLIAEQLDLKDIEIVYNYVPDNMQKGNFEYYAIVQKIDFKDGYYQIFLNKDLSDKKLAVTLCHELVHIKQYEDGRLKTTKTGYVWEGKEYKYANVPYERRGHEIEAMRLQRKIYKEIKKKISWH